MESTFEIWTKWPYKLIVCGTTIECQCADEAIALADLIQAEASETPGQCELAPQN